MSQQQQQQPEVSTDDLANLSPEAIQAIVAARLPSLNGGASYTDREQHFEAGAQPAPPVSDPQVPQGEDFDPSGLIPPPDSSEAPEGSQSLDDRSDDEESDDEEETDRPDDGYEDEWVQVGDQRIPLRFVQAYQQFDNMYQSDPRLQALLRSYIANGGVIPQDLVAQTPQVPQQPQQQHQPPQQAQPQTLQPPIDLDLDDPATRTLWEAHVATQQRLDDITSHLQTQQQATQAEQMGRSQSIVNRAVQSFKDQHQLSAEDVSKVCGVAQRMNLINAFMQPQDPINGVPQRPDPMMAVERALEVAYSYLPEFRDRQAQTTTAQHRQTRQRKQKLSSLSPRSGGSVPRSVPAPTDEAGRRAAMVAEVAAMQNGTWDGGK